MNGKDLLSAMSHIEDSIIEEAEVKTMKKNSRILWKQIAAAAACIGLAVAFVHLNTPDDTSGQENQTSSQPLKETADDGTENNNNLSVTSKDRIFVNEIKNTADAEASRINYDPERYTQYEWDEDAVREYYGRDMRPSYVPDELHAAAYNGRVNAIIKKAQAVNEAEKEESTEQKENISMDAIKRLEIVNDTVTYDFYHAYNADGMPAWTEHVNAEKGFTLTASKIGIMRDCLYILPDDKMQTSDINGIPVTIGHRKMPYGPYDPKTHEPSGYYDLYAAQFRYDEIDYEIVTHQLELDEIVKIIKGVTGESAQEEDKWGIDLTVENVTPDGLELIIRQSEGEPSGELMTGEAYRLEKKSSEKWMPVEQRQKNAAFHDIAYNIPSNDTKSFEIKWKWLYGTLPAGEYRIVKEIMDFRKSGDCDKKEYYAYFEILEIFN